MRTLRGDVAMRGISALVALFQVMTAVSPGAQEIAAILPGLTHYTIFRAPALPATVIPFLDAQ